MRFNDVHSARALLDTRTRLEEMLIALGCDKTGKIISS